MAFFRVIALTTLTVSFLPPTSAQTERRVAVTRRQAAVNNNPLPEQKKSATSVRPGRTYLESGNPEKALAYCEAVVKSEPENQEASKCIKDASSKLLGLKLAEARIFAQQGERDKVIQTLAPIRGSLQGQDADEADRILARVDKGSARRTLEQLGIPWLQDVVVGLVLLIVIFSCLLLARVGNRFWRWLVWGQSIRRTWRMLPLTDETKVGTGEFVQDAYQRLWQSLKVERDTLPLLNPDRGAVTSVALDFLRDCEGAARDAEEREFLLKDLGRHDPDFFDTASAIHMKVGVVELGLIAQMLNSFRNWFKAGDPTLSGRAFLTADDAVTVELTRSGCGRLYATVVKSVKNPDIIQAAREASEGAVLKMLYLLSNDDATQQQADGAEQLRQTRMHLRRLLQDGIKNDAIIENKQIFVAIACELKGLAGLLSREQTRKLLWQGLAERLSGNEMGALQSFEDAEENARRWIDKHNKDKSRCRLQDTCEALAVYNQACLQDDPEKAYLLFVRVLRLTRKAFSDAHSLQLLAEIGRTLACARLPWSSTLWNESKDDALLPWIDKDPKTKVRRDAELLRQLLLELKQARGAAYLNLATAHPPVRPGSLNDAQKVLLDKAADWFSSSEGARQTPDYWVTRARLSLFQGDYENCRKWANQALQMEPDNEWAIYALAEGFNLDRQLGPGEHEAYKVVQRCKVEPKLPPLIELIKILNTRTLKGAA